MTWANTLATGLFELNDLPHIHDPRYLNMKRPAQDDKTETFHANLEILSPSPDRPTGLTRMTTHFSILEDAHVPRLHILKLDFDMP